MCLKNDPTFRTIMEQAKVEVVYKGEIFTVARAEWSDGKKTFVGEGISRRMFKDKAGDLGETVSKGRAITAMLNKVARRPPLIHGHKIIEYFKG